MPGENMNKTLLSLLVGAALFSACTPPQCAGKKGVALEKAVDGYCTIMNKKYGNCISSPLILADVDDECTSAKVEFMIDKGYGAKSYYRTFSLGFMETGFCKVNDYECKAKDIGNGLLDKIRGGD